MSDIIFDIKLKDTVKKKKYLDNLVKDIINNNCILMVGSGISKRCFGKDRKNLPSWYQFLEDFINWQYRNNKYLKSEFLEIKELLRDNNKFQIVAGDLIEKTTREEFKDFLESIFSPNDIFPSYLHKLFCLFPFRAIITTNYDILIEKAYYELYKKFPKIINYNEIKNGIEIPHNFFIAKIHGDIEDPSTIILSQIDYMNLIHKSPIYIQFLKSLFKKYTVIFTGYSFNDPDIKFIVDNLSFEDNYCYLITSNQEITQIECDRYFKDQKIIVLGFDKTNNSYRQLDIGFEELLELLFVKNNKLFSRIYPLIKKNRFSVLVLYGKNDQKDGLFLQNYFYRNKKIITLPDKQSITYSRILNNFEKLCRIMDFIIIFVGKARIVNTSSKFVKLIEKIEQSKKKYHYKIIIAATPIQKEIIGKRFPDYPTFFVQEKFSDIDILPILNYASNLFSFKLESSQKICPGATTCAYYKPKYDKRDKESYLLAEKYRNEVKEYSEFLAKKDYSNGVKAIDDLISVPEFNLEIKFFQDIICDKIECMYQQNEYKTCIELFDLYKIDTINKRTFKIFQYKALSLSNLGSFEESMKIADDLEKKCSNLWELQDIIYLKQEIFELAHKCLERIKFIKEQLNELPKDLGIVSYLQKALNECLECDYYYEKIEKSK